MEKKIGRTKLRLAGGDLTKEAVDAVVSIGTTTRVEASKERDAEIFVDAVYNLTEASSNLAYTALNDGKWNCMITYPQAADFDPNVDEDVVINVSGVRGISLSEGDAAVCTN